MVLDNPWDSRASSSTFKTADPVFLRIPIPLVAAAAGKLNKVSLPTVVSSPNLELAPDGARTVLPSCWPPALTPFLE